MTLQELTSVFTPEQIAQFTPAQLQALMGFKASSRKPAQTKEKSAVFMKYNKQTGKRDIAVPCTPEQKIAWEKFTSRSYVSKEELQAITDAFTWTPALDAAIVANPAISAKQIHALGGKGCTREMLAQRKVELKVR